MTKTLLISLISTWSIGCAHHSTFDELDKIQSMNQLKQGLENQGECPSGKEYAATYKFLDENSKTMGITEEEIKTLSFEVAKGCLGSAARFLKAYNLLTKVGLGGRSAMATGKILSKLSDDHSNAFLELFMFSYLEEHLNLDIKTSLEIASQLSIEFKGQPMQAYRDFSQLTKFCMEDSRIQADLMSCTKLMATTVKKTELYGKGISEDFISFYDYLKNDDYLKMNVKEALNLTHEVLASGPTAVENFKYSYEFALSEKGLKSGSKDSLSFAKKMVGLSKAQFEINRNMASETHR